MKKMNFRLLTMALAVLMIAVGLVGTTLAWLTDKTEAVTNTFVAGQIGKLELKESDQDQTFTVIPGVNIPKDPTVTYTPDSDPSTNVPVDAYVFVKITGNWTWNDTDKLYEIKNKNNDVVMSFAIDADWKKLGTENVFYREVGATAITDSVIAGNTITVSSAITEDDVETVAANANGLTFKAYAIQ